MIPYTEFWRRHASLFLPYCSFDPQKGQFPIMERGYKEDIYFPEFIKLIPDEVFCDCGAWRGDTVEQFLRRSPGYKKIYALEPDLENYSVLEKTFRLLPDFIPMKCAASNVSFVQFNSNGKMSARVEQSGQYVHAIKLDSLEPKPTFVKMDIEGSELEALDGAANLIREGNTVFAVTTYHKFEHLTAIPDIFYRLNPSLKVFFRQYGEDWTETVCYAVPEHRLNG